MPKEISEIVEQSIPEEKLLKKGAVFIEGSHAILGENIYRREGEIYTLIKKGGEEYKQFNEKYKSLIKNIL